MDPRAARPRAAGRRLRVTARSGRPGSPARSPAPGQSAGRRPRPQGVGSTGALRERRGSASGSANRRRPGRSLPACARPPHGRGLSCSEKASYARGKRGEGWKTHKSETEHHLTHTIRAALSTLGRPHSSRSREFL